MNTEVEKLKREIEHLKEVNVTLKERLIRNGIKPTITQDDMRYMYKRMTEIIDYYEMLKLKGD